MPTPNTDQMITIKSTTYWKAVLAFKALSRLRKHAHRPSPPFKIADAIDEALTEILHRMEEQHVITAKDITDHQPPQTTGNNAMTHRQADAARNAIERIEHAACLFLTADEAWIIVAVDQLGLATVLHTPDEAQAYIDLMDTAAENDPGKG